MATSKKHPFGNFKLPKGTKLAGDRPSIKDGTIIAEGDRIPLREVRTTVLDKDTK